MTIAASAFFEFKTLVRPTATRFLPAHTPPSARANQPRSLRALSSPITFSKTLSTVNSPVARLYSTCPKN